MKREAKQSYLKEVELCIIESPVIILIRNSKNAGECFNTGRFHLKNKTKFSIFLGLNTKRLHWITWGSSIAFNQTLAFILHFQNWDIHIQKHKNIRGNKSWPSKFKCINLKHLFHNKCISIQLLQEPQSLHKLKVAILDY